MCIYILEDISARMKNISAIYDCKMEDKRYQLGTWNICVYTSDKKMSPVVSFYES